MLKDFGQMTKGTHQMELDVKTINSGLYLLQWTGGATQQTEKIIIKK